MASCEAKQQQNYLRSMRSAPMIMDSTLPSTLTLLPIKLPLLSQNVLMPLILQQAVEAVAVEVISTMSTAEAAAALEVYRVVDKLNNEQPATTLEASAFVSRIVTSGVQKVSTVVPRTADQAQDSVIEGSSDDSKSISDLSA
eukprot:gene12588-14556_t